MNTRLIAILSSIVVLSSATSSTETVTTPVPGNGGSTVPAAPSTSQTIPKTSTLPSTSATPTTSHTTDANLLNQTLKTMLTSTILVTTPTKMTNKTNHITPTNNNMNTTTTHSSNINSSSVLGENTTEVPSGTTEAPSTDHHTTIEPSTKIQCNCSEYVTPSSVTKKPQTSTKSPNITTTPPASMSSMSTSPTTKATTLTTTAPSASMSPSPTTNATSPTAEATPPTAKATSPRVEATSPSATATPPTANATSPTVKATSPTATATPPTAKATSPTVKATSPTAKATSLTAKATSPTVKVTSPTVKATSPTAKATSSAVKATSPTVKATSPTVKATSQTAKSTLLTAKATSLMTKASSSMTKAPLSIITAKPANMSTTPNTTSLTNDEIQSDEQSILYDDTSSRDLYCMNKCNITMNETTPVPPLTTTTERKTTTTPKPTTTTPRHRSIDLSGKLVDLNLFIVVMGNFTQDLKDHSSKNYINLAKQYNTSLNQFYRRLLPEKFKKIVILGFSNGSIKCNYLLEMNAPINESNANSTLQILRNVNWTTDSLANLMLDVNKTTTAQAALSSNDLVFLPPNVCVNNEVLEWDDDGNPICKYKCDTPAYKGKCGDHGECSFTYGGVFRCICKDGYSARGNKCETPNPTTTTAKPIKPDDIALSKIDIIGIAGGIGGGLVLILLVALCCVYTKLNKAKKRDRFYGYMDNDKEFLHDENSRIENVPDLKNEYTNLGYQTEQNELQMQRFEPEGKNVEYEPGQRQGAYERDDKAYRQVEEPEGGNVLIYQPKHLNGPMERQSGASKFDEVEERSNPYRMMDTDTTYKIRRPTVNSDRNVPYN